MTVHAYLSQPQTPVVFVPVYFGYERLLEGRAFTKELAGGKKQRETIFALVKSLKILKENYGRVYVSIGDPIALDELLSKHNPGWRDTPLGAQRPDWIKPVVDELGTTIMQRINETASVTPVSLLATILLATPRGCISTHEFSQQVDIYQRLLKGAYANSLVSIPVIDAQELIAHGSHLGFIETTRDNIGSLIQLRSGQAGPLTYFRNNILHVLTLPALIAASFANRRHRDFSEIQHLVSLTFPIIQAELFLPANATDELLVQTLDGLASAGLLSKAANTWSRAPSGSLEAVALKRLANVVTPALERDYLCACLIAQAAAESIDADILQEQCKITAERLEKTHGMVSAELYDKHVHAAFLNALAQHGYISRTDNLIKPSESLLRLEDEARALISESCRHAIIAASCLVSASNSPDS